MSRELLVEMADRMVVGKDQAMIPHYYDPEFVMTLNGVTQEYDAFRVEHENATRLELVLIASYREGRILRLWELTWPNWAELPAFESYAT